jgi:hypothetical protein
VREPCIQTVVRKAMKALATEGVLIKRPKYYPPLTEIMTCVCVPHLTTEIWAFIGRIVSRMSINRGYNSIVR